MGVSHSGVVYVENGVAKNLDMPMDAEYISENVSSAMDSSHYLETAHFQIVRPRNFSAAASKNLLDWVSTIRKNYAGIRAKGLLRFNPDYSMANIDKYSKDDAFVTTAARILTGKDTTSSNLKMFCSEFVWSMLSLSNCSPLDAEIGNSAVADATCVKPIFKAMYMTAQGPIPGIGEGPLAVLEGMNDLSVSQKNDLVAQLFTQGEASGLSAGHRALAANPDVNLLISALKAIFPAKLMGQDAAVASTIAKINAKGGRNYSPASFLINSMLETSSPERKFDYVATIIFNP
jgi:hypothetical protein